MVANIVTAVLLIVYLALAWFAGTLIELNGARLWVLRIALAMIGFVAAGLFLWFERKLKRDRLMSGPNAGFVTEIDSLLQAAAGKLREKNIPLLSGLPIVYVLGESNTAKTSVLQYCGLEPELLAGEPEREGQIAATSTINVWFARDTVFIEAGGGFTSDPVLWKYLLEKTQPEVMSSSISRKPLPSRAIVACCDCEKLAASGEANVASGKKLSARLCEAAETLSCSLPVYVLFTKLDRVSHFAEFAGNLSQQEAAQVLGTTLPRTEVGEALLTHDDEGTISAAFDQIIYALADKRIDYLQRETATSKFPSIYEFPRELRKLRQHLVQFLMEIACPGQWDASCFLRGFYFSGVRAVIVSETVTPKVTAAAAASVAAATRMFNTEDLNALTQGGGSSAPMVQTRKVPEWTFLPRLFSEVILNDKSALAVSSRSRNVEQCRAALFATLAVAFFISAGMFAFSFLQNRALEQKVLGAAQSLQSSSDLPTGQIASVDQLKQLDTLRQMLLQLEDSARNGHALSQRFGLYTGDHIYPDARQIYFNSFGKLLLHPAQTSILQKLSALPATPAPTGEFGESYNALKAYLITTTNHDKSSADFLVLALLNSWSSSRDVDDERQNLARRQLEYYSAQLATSDPLSSQAESDTVQHARQYLRQFNGAEQIYQSMLAAARKSPDINFNRRYPESAQVLTEAHSVPGAYTRGGFVVMQDAINNPDKYYGAEEWVLGEASAINLPKDKLQEDVRDRYTREYLNHWREFLRSATLARYASANDAANKLRILSGNRSPLMLLFWIAADNTSVDLPGAAKSFDSVQRVANGATEDHPIGTGAQLYMTELNALQGALSAVAATPEALTDSSGPINAALVAAGAARSGVGQVAQGFMIDSEGHIDSQVRKLMEDPVVSAESLVRRLVQQQAQRQQATKQ
jgi:type VI secretion system protein ImpL